MDEKQLLEAIRGIVQEETGKIVDNRLNSFREEISGQINGLREEMSSHNRETRILVENGYKRIENLLREDYGRVADFAAKGAAVAESHKELKGTVADHDRALQNHNQRITKLEKQAI